MLPDSPDLCQRAMSAALSLAREATAAGEVPVGAVITCDGEIVSRARNRREEEKNALCHAELAAIDAACRALGGWRLHRCTLYVTLEPCPMCAGAAVGARVARIVVGARDERGGALGSVVDLASLPGAYRPEVCFDEGAFREESARLLRDFFASLRERRN